MHRKPFSFTVLKTSIIVKSLIYLTSSMLKDIDIFQRKRTEERIEI